MFALCELATISPLGWHTPNVVDNTGTLYKEDKHWQQTALVSLDIYFSVFIICLFVSHFVSGFVCNSSLVFENSVLWGFQWSLSQKMIETQWLTLDDWGCPLDNDPKLVLGKPSGR